MCRTLTLNPKDETKRLKGKSQLLVLARFTTQELLGPSCEFFLPHAMARSSLQSSVSFSTSGPQSDHFKPEVPRIS